MASKPGILNDWPWKRLESFQEYMLLSPWAIHSVYSFTVNNKETRDLTHLLIFPTILLRMLHNQIWISLSRYRPAKTTRPIVKKRLEFDQLDRKRNWENQIMVNGVVFYIANRVLRGESGLPLWKKEGVMITILLHAGPVEFLSYWLHRALHNHYLYYRYHSHQRSSVVAELITSLVHPMAKHLAYYLLFAIPLMTTVFTGTASLVAYLGYITYIDFMNNIAHSNFYFIPKSFFSLFPPLKYLISTPSPHSMHPTKFRTNYSLFLPFYDYMYGTMDKVSDQVHETSLQRKGEDSIFHLKRGFAKWYTWLMWPVTFCSMMLTWISSRTFNVDRHAFDILKLQSWILPNYSIQVNS